MRRLRYTPEARRSMRSAARYILDTRQDAGIARRFLDDFDQKCSSLAELPGTLGRARPELRPDLRYVEDVFEVVDILDGRRDIDSYFSEH